MPPLISVVIPLYNHEKYIAKAVSSVLNQTYSNIELIVIDDGSNDSSYDIVANISDARLRHCTQTNQGADFTLNRGIKEANGDYISLLNSDDMYHSRRLEEFIHIFSRSPEVDALFSRVEAINDDDSHLFYFANAPKHDFFFNHVNSKRRLPVELFEVNIVTTTSNIMCKKEVFDDVGLFRNYRYCHDLDFFLRLFRRKYVQIVDQPLLKYRVHEHNTLKEDAAMVEFETAIVLADFLHKEHLRDLFPGLSREEVMAVFFALLSRHRLGRVLHAFAQFDPSDGTWKEARTRLLQEKGHPLRIACLEYIAEVLEKEKKREASNRAEMEETVCPFHKKLLRNLFKKR